MRPEWTYHRPQGNTREGNVFTGVCQSFCPQSASWLLVHCWSLLRRCRYASEMFFCLFITIDSTYTPDSRTGSAATNISNTSKRTACPTASWSVWLTGSGRIAPASPLYYLDQVRIFKFKNLFHMEIMIIIWLDRTKHPAGSKKKLDFLSKQKYNKHICLKIILHS